MDALDAIFSRRSIRKYTGQELNSEQIEALLRAAMAAPNTVNNRDWAFVVVKDRNVMKQIIANQQGDANMLAEAPVAIIVCGDLSLVVPKYPEFWVQDCSAATENIILAATAMGIGSVWLGTYPIAERVKGLQTICNLPKHIIPFSMVALGFPAEEKPKRDQYEPQKVHYDRW